jgi:hypothetical protein
MFHLAAQTEQAALLARGQEVVPPKLVTSFQDFNRELTSNGQITGTVTVYAHGDHDGSGYTMLALSHLAGVNTNVSRLNVGQLSGANLGPDVKIYLRACLSGFGGNYSIAKLIATRLGRVVYAAPVYYFFSKTPDYRGMVRLRLPVIAPVYLIPNEGKAFEVFQPIRTF